MVVSMPQKKQENPAAFIHKIRTFERRRGQGRRSEGMADKRPWRPFLVSWLLLIAQPNNRKPGTPQASTRGDRPAMIGAQLSQTTLTLMKINNMGPLPMYGPGRKYTFQMAMRLLAPYKRTVRIAHGGKGWNIFLSDLPKSLYTDSSADPRVCGGTYVSNRVTRQG